MSKDNKNHIQHDTSKLAGFKLDFEYNCTYRDERRKTKQRGNQ